MSLIELLEKIIPVIIAGLFFGAGLPALYSFGMRLLAGTTEYTADGKLIEIEPPSRASRAAATAVFAIIVGIVFIGILWVAKDFIYHTFGWNIFGVTGGGH
ncbi:MAG: hypothetical protein Q3991_08070 [Rothia sp. (in: high G+C Gram-positive bacteria)]|uniref:hypothetical protein n=1 Tax=Rothia sp. (in: high G+C Gram-positive bacteria) TaxID=1885016 RepID=UPI0026DDBDEB|nr:hypothetical protein [Rothia sp. (in: high G+C Gram-positive bacteria)]MDO4884888.1 hypothetical protein [Rothia sp. (in: high G+C Gram-positive bacteria)]